VEGKWVSPKSTLDAALWESDSDSEEADDELSMSHNTADRIKALACPAWVLPDWDSEGGWIDVLSAASTETEETVAVLAEETTDLADAITSKEPNGAEPGVEHRSDSIVPCGAETDGDSVWHSSHQSLHNSVSRALPCSQSFCNGSNENSVCPIALVRSASLCVSDHILYFFLDCRPPLRTFDYCSKFQEQVDTNNMVTPRRVAVTLI
jgi:hypothetical protein